MVGESEGTMDYHKEFLYVPADLHEMDIEIWIRVPYWFVMIKATVWSFISAN